MIEIMVAISVMLILMAIAVIGYRYLDRTASEKATHTVLSNAQALVADYEASKGAGSVNDLGPGVSTATAVSSTTALGNTPAVMAKLVSVPKNKDAITNLPAKMLKAGVSPPALLDGWGNPIAIVPRGGLSAGGKTIVHPEGRPFWASGGADGDLNTPDDNIYSFEK